MEAVQVVEVLVVLEQQHHFLLHLEQVIRLRLGPVEREQDKAHKALMVLIQYFPLSHPMVEVEVVQVGMGVQALVVQEDLAVVEEREEAVRPVAQEMKEVLHQ